MSWIATDAAFRLRGELGIYEWWEWPRFCSEHNIEVRVLDPHDDAPEGFHVEVRKSGRWRRVIWVRADAAMVMALVIWHEIAHFFGFPLNAAFWMHLRSGHVVVRQMERRAEHFALVFPVWRSSPTPFLPN